MKLRDRVAIVTGGASGIGQASVRTLAAEGAVVMIGDIDRARSEALATELSAAGHTVVCQCCDLTDPEDVRRLIEATIAGFGRLDILVNCAGGSGTSPFYKTEEGSRQRWTEEIPEREWENTLALNLAAPFYCIKYALAYMKKAGKGTIINFSSVGADVGHNDSSFAYAAYAAAKAGITGLTRHLARELGPFGITVNCVCPGTILSERMARRFETDEVWRQLSEQHVKDQVPLRRLGAPDEVAAAVAFLASDDAAYISGVTLDVNGGMYMR